MSDLFKSIGRGLLVILAASVFTIGVRAQTGDVSLRGQVFDQSGGAIPALTVTLIGPDGATKTVQTDENGKYAFRNLPPGTYKVQIKLQGFADFVEPQVVIAPGKAQVLDAHLIVALEKQQVTVTEQAQGLSVSSENNASQLVLKGEDLNALSDDPDELSDELQALAGPAAGPNGGQIYIDGFTGGTLPPKSSILEIIVNQSPFSAEYDRLGFGRIQIITKPGSDKLHGMGFFNFGDSAFNSRNPFSPTRPSYHTEMGEGNIGGPMGKKASFFFDLERRDIGQAAVIDALTLDSSNNVVPFSESVLDPSHRTELGPRFDFQLTPKNALTLRYRWEGGGQVDAGLSAFTLPSQAYTVSNTEQTFQLTETALVSSRTVNNFHFQWNGNRNDNSGSTPGATISVLGAFTGGGSSTVLDNTNQDNYEIQNITRVSLGTHQLEFGGRWRDSDLWQSTQGGFNGAFTFNSIMAYQLTLAGEANGLTPAQIAAQGGGPSQFAITEGTPVASINQYDLGVFAQDDWKMKPNFTLSYGLRYETQNQIGDHHDIAPRIGFAWGVGKNKGSRPKTVIRAGAGIFYDRFGETLTLQALRLNGVTQQRFVIPNPDFFPAIPSLSTLQASLSPQTIYKVDSSVQAPYVFQEAIGIERQLPKNITVAFTYTNSHGVHQLRARDINAPLLGGTRPLGGTQDIFQYESSGIFNQSQLITNVNARISPRYSLFGFYTLNTAHSNTDGAGTFPANQYDLSSEYGQAAFDVRQRLFLGGSIAARYGMRFSPFVTASSGTPFNITIGRDVYGDSLYNARPALAAASATCNINDIVCSPYGNFNLTPGPGDTIIPRNYGVGPGQFSVNLRFAKTFSFGGEKTSPSGGGGGWGGGGGGGGHGGPPGGGLGPGGLSGGGGPGRGDLFGSNSNKRYSLEFSIFARNLLNTTNLATPVGNLTSPLFGHSNSTAGGFFTSSANRMFQAGLRFTF